MRRAARWVALTGSLGGMALLGGCGYDDTPHAMRVIDGESGRPLYARTLTDAATAVAAGAVPEAEAIATVEDAYRMSQEAYVAILDCEDRGVCRRSSLAAVCADAERLLAARRVLAAHSDLLAVHESLATGLPFDADRLRAAIATARRDGRVSELERDLLLLAGAGAAFEHLRAATPDGARDAARRRDALAIDAFVGRCAGR